MQECKDHACKSPCVGVGGGGGCTCVRTSTTLYHRQIQDIYMDDFEI